MERAVRCGPRLLVGGAVFVLVGLLPTGAVRAQVTPEAKAAARTHYNKGKEAFELGRFPEALREYELAYKLAPLPGFLFNIGQCHRNLDNYDKAIFSFRLYLKKLPEARNTAAVKTLIDELERKAEEDRQRQQQAATIPTYGPVVPPPITDPNPPPRPPPPTPFYKKWWFWVPVGAIAVSGAAVGGYYAFRTREASLPPSDLGVWDLSR